MPTVDRRRWIADRIEFLKSRLATEISDAERSAIEVEIETLKKEVGGGRWLGRLLGIPRRPTDR